MTKIFSIFANIIYTVFFVGLTFGATGCKDVSAPRKDFSSTRVTIFTEAVKNHLTIDGKKDVAGALIYFSNLTNEMTRDAFIEQLKNEGATCIQQSDFRTICESVVSWNILASDPYLKCTPPCHNENCAPPCKVSTRVTLLFDYSNRHISIASVNFTNQ